MTFSISERKGFHITFENGWTVSVQFGYGNYCDNYDWQGEDPDDPMSRHRGPVPPSRNAEVAAWPAGGDMIVLDDGDTVAGHYTPAQVLALMNRIAAMPASGIEATSGVETAQTGSIEDESPVPAADAQKEI